MPSPVPILFTIPNFITAGSGRAMLNIIGRLNRHRFAPMVCVLRKGGDLDREVERLGVPFVEETFLIPARPYASLLPRAWSAARPLRRLRPVLWHSFHYSDDYTEPLVARLAGARAWIYTKKNMNWDRRSWYARSFLATRIAAQNTDMVRSFFRTPLLRRKTRLVPRGVDTERFHPAVPSRLGIRQKLRIPPGAILAGTVAQLVPVKGHPTALEALARVPGLVWLVAGERLDAEYAGRLQQMTAELGLLDRVHFLGAVGDVPALLTELDVFVLPTWARWRMEGCPVALLEAMACGRACVATNIPGARDIIVPDRSGLLVPPEDPAALADALRRLTTEVSRRKALGEEARDRIVEHYSIQTEVAAHEALYAEALPREVAE